MTALRNFAAVACIAMCSGCSVDDEPLAPGASEPLGTSVAPLAAADWTLPSSLVGGNHHNVAVAFLGNTAYAVVTNVNTVFFSRLGAGNVWSTPTAIPGATTRFRVALTAFNGSLYLVTEGPSEHAVRLARFDPTTQAWSAASQLPFLSAGVPGLAVHQGRLFFLGTEPATYRIWSSSMAPDGSFSPAETTPLRGWATTAASLGGRLHAAYTSFESSTVYGDIRHAVFDGTTWGTPETISTGFGGRVLRGTAAMARYAGGLFMRRYDCLHLAVLDDVTIPLASSVWWSYACGSAPAFSVPVTIPGLATNFAPALAADSARLLVAYRHPAWGNMRTQSYSYPWPTIYIGRERALQEAP